MDKNVYKNDNNTVDMLKVVHSLIDKGEEKPKPEPTKEELRRKRSFKGGVFSIDPETFTLYFIAIDKYNIDFPIPLGDTQYYRMAELIVKNGEKLLPHKEIYEYVFKKSYAAAFEPDKELRYFIRRFKNRLNKDPRRKFKKRFLDYMFASVYGQGYFLHNKM